MANTKGNFIMQKVIDWYFLIVSSVITITSLNFIIQENNWGNILLFCFSTMVSILYIINILKTITTNLRSIYMGHAFTHAFTHTVLITHLILVLILCDFPGWLS